MERIHQLWVRGREFLKRGPGFWKQDYVVEVLRDYLRDPRDGNARLLARKIDMSVASLKHAARDLSTGKLRLEVRR